MYTTSFNLLASGNARLPTKSTHDTLLFNPVSTRASDKCIAEKRKTITGDDILVAMATLGFDNYIEPLKLYLQKYREVSLYHFSCLAMSFT